MQKPRSKNSLRPIWQTNPKLLNVKEAEARVKSALQNGISTSEVDRVAIGVQEDACRARRQSSNAGESLK